MKSLLELGEAVAVRRKERHLTQAELARHAGVTRELVARFEGGRVTEFGARKLMAVLAVLGLEMTFAGANASGSLDELRRERGGV